MANSSTGPQPPAGIEPGPLRPWLEGREVRFRIVNPEPFTWVGDVPYAVLLRGDRDVAVRVTSIHGVPA